MNSTTTRSTTLDSNSVDAAIDALASAAASFGLTRRERIIYRTLMLGADFAALSTGLLLVDFLLYITVKGADDRGASVGAFTHALLGLALASIMASGAAGMIAFLLNAPLLRRALRERKKFKALGLTAVSISLWKASRRQDWPSRIRGVSTVVAGILLAVLVLLLVAFTPRRTEEDSHAVLYFVVGLVSIALLVGVLFGARHLRNLREQMDLASNAEKLKKALQALRIQGGRNGDIAVPMALVDEAAMIERIQISKDRNEAILQGAGSRSTGYAVTFTGQAAAQRAALGVPKRLKLEDLVARLSLAGVPPDAAGRLADNGNSDDTFVAEDGPIVVKYAIDHEVREIRVTAVRELPASHDGTASGVSDA